MSTHPCDLYAQRLTCMKNEEFIVLSKNEMKMPQNKNEMKMKVIN